MNIYGKEISRREALQKTGRIGQLCGTRHYELTQGKAKGLRCVDVNCGEFAFTVLPDRCMDISLARFQGCNLAYHSIVGEVAPAYYDREGAGFSDSFFAGLLTTCGLSHLGQPSEDGPERLGLHGRIANQPAENVADRSRWEEDAYRCELRGTMIEGSLFGHKLKMTRTIRAMAGESRLFLTDEIENLAMTPAPLTLLYHINLGFPLLDETGRWKASQADIRGYDERSQACIDDIEKVTAPTGGFQELNYLLKMKQGPAWSMFYNPAINGGLGLYVKWDAQELPYMTLWKNFDGVDYVMSMEPANCPCEPRAKLRAQGLLPELAPGEKKRFSIEIGVTTKETF